MLFTWHREAQAYATRRQDSTYVILNPRHPHNNENGLNYRLLRGPRAITVACDVISAAHIRSYRGVTHCRFLGGIGYVMASSIITPSPITCPIPITYQVNTSRIALLNKDDRSERIAVDGARQENSLYSLLDKNEGNGPRVHGNTSGADNVSCQFGDNVRDQLEIFLEERAKI
ncbi:hypothetical protein EVAR_98820_1 [Eumeta japonica]|uniref:Uncharacterized protein n=1 Tax=Eumeta variegata TaxID=151549 RepID=A0A4C1SPH0_EUMVA|nr:hypothetical protein EVAR_98820_1 [Eumeta japonica]